MQDQSLTVKSTDTRNQFYSQEWLTEQLKQHQSLETLLDLMEGGLEESLTLLLAASRNNHVRTSALQERAQDWKESEAAYSLRLSDSQKKFNRLLSSLKMSQPLELGDWSKLSKHLPKWGMTVGGRCLLPQALEPVTRERDGLCLPTPCAIDTGSRINKGGAQGRIGKDRPTLGAMAKFKLLPTPCARDWKDNGKSPAELNRNSQTLASTQGGSLSPQFVEELMGYKIGYTELNRWATALFRYKSKSRSRN